MKKSYITGRNHDFYDKGKAMFDRIRVLPEHQAIPQGIPQIPQEHSLNRQWVGLDKATETPIAHSVKEGPGRDGQCARCGVHVLNKD